MHCIAQNILRFSTEFLSNNPGHLLAVQLVDSAEQTENKDVFPSRFGASANRFDSCRSEGDSDVDDPTLVFQFFNIIAIVKADASIFESVKMTIIGMLVKRDQGIGAISGVEDLSRAEVDLKNRRSAGDGAGNRHVGHDLLSSGAGELTKEGPHRLNTVLGVAGEADDSVTKI